MWLKWIREDSASSGCQNYSRAGGDLIQVGLDKLTAASEIFQNGSGADAIIIGRKIKEQKEGRRVQKQPAM